MPLPPPLLPPAPEKPVDEAPPPPLLLLLLWLALVLLPEEALGSAEVEVEVEPPIAEAVAAAKLPTKALEVAAFSRLVTEAIPLVEVDVETFAPVPVVLARLAVVPALVTTGAVVTTGVAARLAVVVTTLVGMTSRGDGEGAREGEGEGEREGEGEGLGCSCKEGGGCSAKGWASPLCWGFGHGQSRRARRKLAT